MNELMQKYEQASTAIKVLFALLIVGCVGYFAYDEFIVPKMNLIKEKEAELSSIQSEIDLLNRDSVKASTIEEELANANREFRKLMEALPQEPAVERVLNEFASLSRITGTEIREFTPSADLVAIAPMLQGSPSAQSGLGTPGQPLPQNNTANPNMAQNKAVVEFDDTNAVGLQLKMFGTFSSVVSFLDMAMSLPRIVRIQDFEIVNVEKDLKLTQKPKLTFNGLFYAYFQKRGVLEDLNGAKGAPVANAKSPSNKVEKPAVDLNKMIDQSYTAKPLERGEQ
jgi:Tfp pilus assembly protein PilO